jgi:hypothetical protein
MNCVLCVGHSVDVCTGGRSVGVCWIYIAALGPIRLTRRNCVPKNYLGNVHGVNIIDSLSEDVEVPGLEGGGTLSDKVVTKTYLIYYILYVPL